MTMMMMMKRRVEQDKRERERVAIVHNVKVIMLLMDGWMEVNKSALDLTLPHCCIRLAIHRCETPRPLVPPIFDC